ncbi:hypothetical protein HispidOSU_017011 [Sigmodon hispidus]
MASSSAPFPGGEMSGLSHLETKGCHNLLGLLDTDKIMALCDTIANRLMQPVNRQDAIHAILVYSQNVEGLLRHKKVHGEVKFKYLAAQGVVVLPSTEKHNLIQYAKGYWEKQSPKLKETSRTSYTDRGHTGL